jgi:hypothetical protein
VTKLDPTSIYKFRMRQKEFERIRVIIHQIVAMYFYRFCSLIGGRSTPVSTFEAEVLIGPCGGGESSELASDGIQYSSAGGDGLRAKIRPLIAHTNGSEPDFVPVRCTSDPNIPLG